MLLFYFRAGVAAHRRQGNIYIWQGNIYVWQGNIYVWQGDTHKVRGTHIYRKAGKLTSCAHFFLNEYKYIYLYAGSFSTADEQGNTYV